MRPCVQGAFRATGLRPARDFTGFSAPAGASALASRRTNALNAGMTLVPRFLIDLVARHRINGLRRRLRQQKGGAAAQQAALRDWLARAERTDFGRQHGLTARTSTEEFRARVPLRTTAEFRPWVERMAGGEADVLRPGRCRLFVYTAGTVDGSHRVLPAPPEMLLHFRRGLTDTVLLHAMRTGDTGVFHGRHLHAGGSARLTSANGVYAGYLDAIPGLALSEWAEKNLHAPATELARQPAGPEKTAALAAAYAGSDVRLAAGTPAALLALADALEPHGGLRGAWPRLECLLTSGALPLLHQAELQGRLGPQAALHEVYAAAEGIFAAQDGEPGAGLRVLADAGIYFEFLPLGESAGSAAPLALGSRCVPLEGVRAGESYALVVTTPAGLGRCLIGDAVRFVSTTPPRLVFAGRLEHRLDAFGEGVDERDLTETLLEVCARNDWHAVNFHVAPLHLRQVPRPQGCHEWWIELRPRTVRTPTGPLLAGEIDAELGRRQRGYTTRRANGALSAPLARLVIPGTFAQWAQLHAPGGGQGKPAPCRGDRLVADQLAGIARFHSGTLAPFDHGPDTARQNRTPRP